MTLQASGTISLKDIQTEFGGSDPANLNEYYTGSKTTIPTGYGIPSSGAISLGDFRGTQKFSLNYITAIDANALGSPTAGGSVELNISARAGNLDRYIVLATGMAQADTTIVIYGGATYTINGNPVTTIFNNGFVTDGDGHRVAMVYRKITNGASTVTVGWSALSYPVPVGERGASTVTVYYEPDRGHAIFVYELTGIPTMGTVNSTTGAGGNTADMVLTGSTKRCAILITTINSSSPPTSMTNATITTTLNGRHTSWYDTNMGSGTLTYSTNVTDYGCFGGASFPY